MSVIEQCRSAALGGHVLRCEGCGADQIAYNSCRNRHCPKCQSSAAKRWLDARQADLLPVAYYQVVFTLPAPIADIATRTRPWSMVCCSTWPRCSPVADSGSGVRVVVTGAGPCVFRVREMEKALASKFASESVGNIKIPDKGLNPDIHASAEYRAHQITVRAKRAVQAALG